MSTLEIIERDSPLWEKAWAALSAALPTLPSNHPLFGERSIDPFMLMYRRDKTVSFKHIPSRAYVHIQVL